MPPYDTENNPENYEDGAVLSEVALDDDELKFPGTPGWMVTFGDSISLLLTFFVLIIAFSNVDQESSVIKLFEQYMKGTVLMINLESEEEIEEDTDERRLEDKRDTEGGVPLEDEVAEVEREANAKALELEESNDEAMQVLYEDVQEEFTDAQAVSLEDKTEEKNAIESQYVSTQQSLCMLFDTKLLFRLGKASLREERAGDLDRIGGLIAVMPNDIMISGYADDVLSIAFPQYATNLELAIARANTIAEYLIATWGINAERIGIKAIAGNSDKLMNDVSVRRTVRKITITILPEFNGFVRNELKLYERKRHTQSTNAA